MSSLNKEMPPINRVLLLRSHDVRSWFLSWILVQDYSQGIQTRPAQPSLGGPTWVTVARLLTLVSVDHNVMCVMLTFIVFSILGTPMNKLDIRLSYCKCHLQVAHDILLARILSLKTVVSFIPSLPFPPVYFTWQRRGRAVIQASLSCTHIKTGLEKTYTYTTRC